MNNSRHFRSLVSILLRSLPGALVVLLALLLNPFIASAACTGNAVAQSAATTDFTAGQPFQPWMIYVLGAVVVAGLLVGAPFVVRARRRSVLNGVEGMIGTSVVAITPLTPEGRVNYFGENWAAILVAPTQSVRAGTELQVLSVQGLCLYVRPLGADPRTNIRLDSNID